MGDDAQRLEQLGQCLTQTLSPDKTAREAAEHFLTVQYTINPEPEILNPKPETLNPEA